MSSRSDREMQILQGKHEDRLEIISLLRIAYERQGSLFVAVVRESFYYRVVSVRLSSKHSLGSTSTVELQQSTLHFVSCLHKRHR